MSLGVLAKITDQRDIDKIRIYSDYVENFSLIFQNEDLNFKPIESIGKISVFEAGNNDIEIYNLASKIIPDDFILIIDGIEIDNENFEKLAHISPSKLNGNLIKFPVHSHLNQIETIQSEVCIYKKDEFVWANENGIVELKAIDKIQGLLINDIIFNRYRGNSNKVLDSEKSLFSIYKSTEENMSKENFEEALKLLYKLEEQKDQFLRARFVSVIEKIVICCLRLNNFTGAYSTVEKYFTFINEPRFLLLYAELKASQNLVSSKTFFSNYIELLETGKYKNTYDYERYNVYPYFMMGKIHSQLSEKDQTIKYLNIAIANTHISKSRKEINEYLEKLKY